MDNCNRLQQISAFHDGELNTEERDDLLMHIDQCSACREELETLEKLSNVVSAISEPSVSTELVTSLHREVDSSSQATILKIAEAVSSVAATILVVCSFWLWHIASSGPASNPMPGMEDETLENNIRYMQTGKTENKNLGKWMMEGLASNGNGNND
jgi:hypothetical protein